MSRRARQRAEARATRRRIIRWTERWLRLAGLNEELITTLDRFAQTMRSRR